MQRKITDEQILILLFVQGNERQIQFKAQSYVCFPGQPHTSCVSWKVSRAWEVLIKFCDYDVSVGLLLHCQL